MTSPTFLLISSAFIVESAISSSAAGALPSEYSIGNTEWSPSSTFIFSSDPSSVFALNVFVVRTAYFEMALSLSSSLQFHRFFQRYCRSAVCQCADRSFQSPYIVMKLFEEIVLYRFCGTIMINAEITRTASIVA